MKKGITLGFVFGFGAAIVLVAYFAFTSANPQQEEEVPRLAYYPNTETLASDEMRVIACGTGMPSTRMAQAAACFLVELGNGEKFIFDIGSGSAERISALQIPYDYLKNRVPLQSKLFPLLHLPSSLQHLA